MSIGSKKFELARAKYADKKMIRLEVSFPQVCSELNKSSLMSENPRFRWLEGEYIEGSMNVQGAFEHYRKEGRAYSRGIPAPACT